MKNLFLLLTAGALFTLVACGNGGDTEEAATEEAATEEAGPTAHVHNDICTEEACHLKCGEEGHVCSDACHAPEEHDGHDHGDGNDHDHGDESEG